MAARRRIGPSVEGLDRYELQYALANRWVVLKFVYSIIGLVLGLVCIITGAALFFAGVVGATSWTASLLGLQSKVTDAAPGSVLFIVGLFVVWATRFRGKTSYYSNGGIRDHSAPIS
jgi:hypothetical protein